MAGIVLAIDTSGSFCSVALHDGRAIHWCHSSGEGDHFEQLPSLVRAVCADAQASIRQLTGVLVGVGPGSFTGIRIGMSFAKGLAWATRIPCVGVCSFLGAAASYAAPGSFTGRITVVSDARRSELFYGVYEAAVGVVSVVSEPIILGVTEVIERAQEGGSHLCTQRDMVIPGVKLEAAPRLSCGILSASQAYQSAQEGAFCVGDIAALAPCYIREVSAKTIQQRRLGLDSGMKPC
jgi:tRNA threonylcarbamoyl adenosine modification protein YeaZ